MNIIFSGNTDTGLLRSNNEDAYLLRPDLGLFTVADGVGGSAAGEIASRLFVETAEEAFENKALLSVVETSQLVQEAFRLANERILSYAGIHGSCRGMACTAELIAFDGARYIIGHVGDSRTYLLRGGEFRQVTRDHSLVQSQLEKGLITPEEARKHSLRNVVLRAVGSTPVLELDIIRGNSLPDDLFLLCSDGLTDMLEDNDIRSVLISGEELSGKVERLIDFAKSAGGNDNITVILCQVPAV
jgi:protein phosphatase